MRVMIVGAGAIAYRHAAACRDLDAVYASLASGRPAAVGRLAT